MPAKAAVVLFTLVGLAAAASLPAQFTLYPMTEPFSAGPRGICLGPDGNVWFTALNRVGRITVSGAITTFELPTPNSQPHDIVTGPDGNLWFIEYGAPRRVGRISTEGTIVEYPIPGAGTGPLTIVAGPDGALWFSDFLRRSIWRLSLSGTFTEYPTTISPFAFSPHALAVGSDGNLWFNDFAGLPIGRMTLTGVVTQFPRLAPPHRAIWSMTTGPDGNVWYGVSQGFGYITPSGAMTEFPFVGDRGHAVTGIATGPDGRLWMTVDESFQCFPEVPVCPPGQDGILRVSLAGAQTRFELPAELNFSDVAKITAGPSGSMWFTARRGLVRFFPSELPEPGLPAGVAVPAVGDVARVAFVALLALVGFFLARR